MKYHAPYGSTDPDAPYLDRNTPALQRGSVPPAAAIEQPQREIVDVIEKADMTPDDSLQLWEALLRLGLTPASRNRRWLTIISMTTADAPASPANGDVYLVPVGASGIWEAQVGNIAEWTGSTWSYTSPPDGHGISLPDGRVFERVAGAYVEKLALDVQSGKWTYAAAAGTTAAWTATVSPAPLVAPAAGMAVRLLTSVGNGGPFTLALNGGAAISVLWSDGSWPEAGDFPIGSIAHLVFDGTYWRILGVSPSRIREMIAKSASTRKVKRYLASDTWVKPAGLKYVVVKLVAAGAGGGLSTSPNSTPMSAGGGGNGGYAEDIFSATELPGSVAITIGNGGAGTTGTAVQNGGNGQSTSFGALLSASGGLAGSGASNAYGVGGNGGTGVSNGRDSQIVFGGMRGSDGFLTAGGTYPSHFGQAGRGGQGGFYVAATASGVNGGTGQAGQVIIEEYY